MKKELTPEQVYKKNQRIAKFLKAISPIVFWGLLALAIVFIVFAIKNSFGNIAEITDLLDSKKYTGEELQANYQYLLQKYGEWRIGNGGAYFSMTFVNIKNALFSGLLITDCIMAGICLIGAFVLGKWFLPRLANTLNQNNTDMVNLTILKNQGGGNNE